MNELAKDEIVQILSNHLPDLRLNDHLVNDLFGLMQKKEASSISSRALDFSDTLSKMLEGMQIVDFEWRYIYVNDIVVKHSRYTKEELLGNTMLELYPGIEKTELFATLQVCMDEKVAKYFENKFDYPDGRMGWFELSIQPIPEGLFILSIDITEKKEAEIRLKISEFEYRSLIEQATDGICISDKTGNYIEANESACKMTGYTREEFLKLNSDDLLFEDEFVINPPKFQELSEGKSILTVRKFRTKDLRVIDVEINSKLLANGNILGIVRDISERVRLEEKNALFASMVNSSDDAIISKSLDGVILTWNKGAEKIFGYTSDEIVGSRINVLIPQEFQNEEIDIVAKIKKAESIDHYETYRTKKSGELIPVSVTISPIKNNKGQIIGATKILRDISNRKEIESKIKLLNEELEYKVMERTALLEKSLKLLRESEEKFQKAFQASAAGVAITKVSDARFTDVNDAFVNITGYSRDEIIGRTALELGYIVNAPKREEMLKQIREKGKTQHFENTLRAKTGVLKEVLSSSETIMIDEEWFAISVVFDITDRKRAEEELKKSDALFTSLFEYNPASLVISRIKDGKIISVNEAFLGLFEYDSKSEVIGKSSTELNIIQESTLHNEALRQINEDVKIVRLEGAVNTKLGNQKWISFSVIKIEIDNDECLLTVVQDITQRKIAEEQLLHLNKELEAFSYSISHDLRAPLRAINGYSQMLSEDYEEKLDDEGKRILQVISSNAIKMGILIDELLEFSRLGRKELKKSLVDMEQLATNVLDEINKNTKHNATIQINALGMVKGDSGLLYQVMFNLLSNALKYSSKIESAEIEISSIVKDGEVVFLVSDNGAGFDMVYAEKLFGVFQRLHYHDEFEGIGVGLAIVKRIIAKHGGKVWAYGEVNKGATFYFSIPK